MLHRLISVAVLVAVCGVLAAAVATANGLPGYPLLASRAGGRVYGPPTHAHAPCPATLAPPANARSLVKRAVALAMPPFEARLHLDGRNPGVEVYPSTRSGFTYRAGGCGREVWNRSLVVSVSLPHIRNSSSLSHHTFAVARVRGGWVMWGWIR